MSAPGPIVSLSGRYLAFGNCGEVGGAPFIYDHWVKEEIGLYIDDTTPNRRQWVDIALKLFTPGQKVFVGIAPGEEVPDLPAGGPPHLIRLKEHLPWGMGSNWRDFGPVPNCGRGNGYILQKHWVGESGHNPPSVACWETCLAEARIHRPSFIFLV